MADSTRQNLVELIQTRGGIISLDLDPGEDAYLDFLRAGNKFRKQLRPSKHPRIVFYGASRVPRDDPAFIKTMNLSERFSALGIDTVHGAGLGLMLAAHLGALKGKEKSKAWTIGLPIGGALDGDPVTKLDKSCFNDVFFPRFDGFDVLGTLGYICGRRVGIGTDAEAGILLQLAQFGLLGDRAFVMVGDYWKRRQEFMINEMVRQGTAREDELRLATIVDDEDDAFEIFVAQLEKFRQRIAAA